jgi:hypothetical protein
MGQRIRGQDAQMLREDLLQALAPVPRELLRNKLHQIARRRLDMLKSAGGYEAPSSSVWEIHESTIQLEIDECKKAGITDDTRLADYLWSEWKLSSPAAGGDGPSDEKEEGKVRRYIEQVIGKTNRRRQVPSASQDTPPTVVIFLSHSSDDSEVAYCIAESLSEVLSLREGEVRCTSAPRFNLDLQLKVEEALRKEIVDSIVFIGIISNTALRSAWVFLEHGARWEVDRPMIPLLLGKVKPEKLPSPIAKWQVASVRTSDDAKRFLQNVARAAGRKLAGGKKFKAAIARLRKCRDAAPKPSNSPNTLARPASKTRRRTDEPVRNS